MKSNVASACPPFFGICNSRKSKRVGSKIDITHQKMIWRFNCGISSSSFRTRSGHGKSFTRSMNCVAEMATRRLARLQHDSLAARPMVKLRSTGILPASVTARFATTDPLLAGKTIAIRSSENSVRRKRLKAAAAPINLERLNEL